jgi:hypothetical protein
MCDVPRNKAMRLLWMRLVSETRLLTVTEWRRPQGVKSKNKSMTQGGEAGSITYSFVNNFQ